MMQRVTTTMLIGDRVRVKNRESVWYDHIGYIASASFTLTGERPLRWVEMVITPHAMAVPGLPTVPMKLPQMFWDDELALAPVR
jgi:hypothetical protein